MTATTYAALLNAYLDAPSTEGLATLRRAVRSSPGFTGALFFDDVDRLLAEGAYGQALTHLRGLLPGALLSPSYHSRLARAFEATGKPRDADREKRYARAAVSSIRSTGDGSLERPWSVLRLNDEYDMLRAMGKKPERQSMLRRGGRDIDRHETTDGSVYHFDATQLVAH